MKNKTSRKEALKEDIKHVLKELWDTEEEKTFCKIFSRECMNAKGMQKILRHYKTQLPELSYRDDYDAVHYLQNHEAGDFRMLVNYQ